MSSLAHAQGGPRPAFLDNAIFHPGLQVHAIAEPRTDTRLSLLISCFCYTAVAGLIALTVQHREAIKATISTLPPITLVERIEADVAPMSPAPAIPAAPAGAALSTILDSMRQALPIDTSVPDTTPDSLSIVDRSGLSTAQNNGISSVLGARGNTGDVNGSLNRTGGQGGSVNEITLAQVQILHQVNPVYPAAARGLRIQGDVVVRMTIDAAGLPSDVKLISGPLPLHAEALRCARLWRFTPARLNGEAVPAAFHLTLRFVLKG